MVWYIANKCDHIALISKLESFNLGRVCYWAVSRTRECRNLESKILEERDWEKCNRIIESWSETPTKTDSEVPSPGWNVRPGKLSISATICCIGQDLSQVLSRRQMLTKMYFLFYFLVGWDIDVFNVQACLFSEQASIQDLYHAIAYARINMVLFQDTL